MNNYVKLFADEISNWLIDESVFNQSQCKISIYYNYTPDGSNLVVLSYVDDFVYCCTYECLGKWFMYKLVNILHVNFLGYAHWFMYFIISQLKVHFISLDKLGMLHMLLKNI